MTGACLDRPAASGGQGAITQDRVVEHWLRLVPSMDERAAAAVVRVLLHPVDIGLAVPALLAFDPDLEVPVPALRVLGELLQSESDAAALEVASSMRLLGRFDSLFEHLAESRLARYEALALLDPLTGLGNRRAGLRDLERALAHAERYQRALSVAMLDLDGLKHINDTAGHDAGDGALRDLASAIRSCARVDDGAYRIGGDEFLIVAPDSTSEDMGRLVDRLAIVAPGFSAGIASAPADGEDATTLLETADRRLFQRKPGRGGRAPRSLAGWAPAVFGGSAIAAEGARQVLGISLAGPRLALWLVLVACAPLVASRVHARSASRWRSRRDDQRSVVVLAGTLAMGLLAALVPLAASG